MWPAAPGNSCEGLCSTLSCVGVVNVIRKTRPCGCEQGLTRCDPCAVSHCMTPSVLQGGTSGFLPVPGTKKDSGVNIPSHVAPGTATSQATGEGRRHGSRFRGRSNRQPRRGSSLVRCHDTTLSSPQTQEHRRAWPGSAEKGHRRSGGLCCPPPTQTPAWCSSFLDCLGLYEGAKQLKHSFPFPEDKEALEGQAFLVLKLSSYV